eukprot:gene11477-21692_t
MLGHIRKRVQVRRQSSVEFCKNSTAVSPCSSPLTTPTNELPPMFPVFNVNEDTMGEDEQMDVEEVYKTPTQKAIPVSQFHITDTNADAEPYKNTIKLINDLKIKRNSIKKQRLRKSRSGSGSKSEKDHQNQHMNYTRREYFLRSSSTDKMPDS